MTINYREQFMDWWEDVQESDHPLIMDMIATVEDSPHHHEDNVYVHTCMVVEQYIALCDANREVWYYEDMQGAIACVFHDIGKPSTEEEYYSEKFEKVVRSYKNHEVYSASHFMNIWCNNELNIRSIVEDINAFYNIWVMIAYHLPYQLNDQNKSILKTHMEYFGITDVFLRVLNSDVRGRIQDDAASAIERVTLWTSHFNDLNNVSLSDDKTNGELEIMVGVPASGKSTYAEYQTDAVKFSFDALREALFPESVSYQDAFRNFNDYFNDPDRDPMLTKDRLNIGTGKRYGQSEFLQLALRKIIQETPPEEKLIIDNTSLSLKGRRVISQYNKASKRQTKAVMFVKSLDEVLRNEESRDDYDRRGKNVIKTMYYRYFPVLIGEVDDVTIVPPRGYE